MPLDYLYQARGEQSSTNPIVTTENGAGGQRGSSWPSATVAGHPARKGESPIGCALATWCQSARYVASLRS
jgi:hypothetical protein